MAPQWAQALNLDAAQVMEIDARTAATIPTNHQRLSEQTAKNNPGHVRVSRRLSSENCAHQGEENERADSQQEQTAAAR